MLTQVVPLLDAGARGRRDHPDARRERPAAAGPHAALEGRHDPRDSPPCEEQPADDRRRCCGSRLGGCGRPRPRPRWPSRSAGSGRSRSCTRRCRANRATSCISARSCVRSLRLVEETVSSPELRIRFTVDGDAGDLPGEVATPLAVVLNELMQNAVDHAFPEGVSGGEVSVRLDRDDDHVLIEVVDNGAGLPSDFSLEESRGLGLSIVQALVTTELMGSMEMRSVGGTTVHVRVPVAMPRVDLQQCLVDCTPGTGVAGPNRLRVSRRGLRRSSSCGPGGAPPP